MKTIFHFLLFPLLLSIAISAPRAGEKSQRRVRVQPSVPKGRQELPFVESNPAPVPNTEEKKRGFLLFTRPITEPVHSESRPLKNERLDPGGLSAFATPGEWEPITLGIYPLRDLKNFRLRVSDLTGTDGANIPAAQMTVRLQTYWNVGFPLYASEKTYRRVPELLERVNVHSSPARECQRWWIQVHVPGNAGAGVYRGTLTLREDGLDQPVKIPLRLRVLSFPLKQDPAKHYTAYYRPGDPLVYRNKDEAFFQKASANEYQAMRDYGFDQFPTLYAMADSKATKISIRYEEEIPRLMKAGMKGRIPLLGGNAIGRIYLATTPGGKRGSHWAINKMPPPGFYKRVTRLFRELKEDLEKRGLPPVICCPLDEVAASHKEFGVKVYAAVRASGIPTFITKTPTAHDAPDYAPFVDVWCSQPFAIPMEKIVSQKRHEYWTYPNHIAGEKKDRRIMCKGGRMTYGFGFWRSGYTTIIPWHWSWTMKPDAFDYLRSPRSGCGMRIDENGEVIPALYWECFREGRDDARYIYTLQQAVFEREGSSDPKTGAAVQEAKALLQETWGAIHVQQLYLADGMWPSEEFNTRRWRMAQATEKLLAFPAIRKGNAPSFPGGDSQPEPAVTMENILENAIKKGIVSPRDIGEDFSTWKNDTREGRKEITPKAGRDGRPGLRWQVNVDHKKGNNPDYPVGWPRIRRSFESGELDLIPYDFLEFMVRVDSNRDEVADDTTLLGVSIRSLESKGSLFETRKDLGDRQRVWIPLRFPVKEMMGTSSASKKSWQNIKSIQLFIAESDYDDRTSITFDIGSARLLALTKPLLSQIEVPQLLMLPSSKVTVSFSAIGMSAVSKGSHRVMVSLQNGQGKTINRQKTDLSDGGQILLDTADLKPGKYRIKVRIETKTGEICSESGREIEAVAGPFFQN